MKRKFKTSLNFAMMRGNYIQYLVGKAR